MTDDTQAEAAEVPQRFITVNNVRVDMSEDLWNIIKDMQTNWFTSLQKGNIKPSPFKFGQQSSENLLKVFPPLIALTSYALQLSAQDFGVTCGERSQADQAKAVATGMSRTMYSLHLPQKDGWAHAVDLVPWVGAYAWDWNRIYNIAAAMHVAATITGVASSIRWGGAWDRRLSDFGDQPSDFAEGVKAYAARHAGSDLLDGPHFEWVLD